MYSPRRSSSGTYSTFIPIPIVFPSVTDDLIHMALYTSEQKMRKYVNSMPIKSWIGKKIFDFVVEEDKNNKRTHNLADRLWKAMIRCDEERTNSLFASLDPSQASSAKHTIIRIDNCFQAVEDQLVLAVLQVVSMNPAASRSQSLSELSLTKLAVNFSFLDSTLRRQWKKIARDMIKLTYIPEETLNY